MKKKIKMGIPRAFLYYRYYILWKTFFEIIGCNIVLSPNTDSNIVKLGTELSVDESCFPSKIYLGHVGYLINKCDYILVPRIYSYGVKKRVCVNFNSIYDVINNTFNDIKILDYNIDNLRFKYELFGFIKMGLKLNKNIFRVIYAYIMGKIKQSKYNRTFILKQDKIIRNNKIKVLIVSHPYVVYDKYLAGDIISYFKNEDIDILYSDRMDRKEATYYAEEESNTLYFLYAKENIGSAFYYKDIVDGIIFLSSFPCGIDSLVNELVIRKLNNIPSINIVVDDSTSTSGLYTKLESFVDIIRVRHDNG